MKLAQHDVICEFCRNAPQGCQFLCAPLQWIDGDTPRHETLLRDIANFERCEYRDGNKIVAALIEDKRNAADIIITIKDYRVRLLSLGVWGGIPKPEIGKLMFLSHSQINRIMSGK